MSYTITITETRGKGMPRYEWRMMISNEEAARLRAEAAPDVEIKQFDYAAVPGSQEVETRTVLTQQVDELDLEAVLAAINGLQVVARRRRRGESTPK